MRLNARKIAALLSGTLLLPLAVHPSEAATQVYYSVGTSRASLIDLKVGSPTVTIAAGVATFSVPQAANVGVGDEISYGAGPTLAYISSRSSATQYTVTDRLGVPAANVLFHSSELLPGASPYNRSGADVDRFLASLESLLAFAAGEGIEGRTFREFRDEWVSHG